MEVFFLELWKTILSKIIKECDAATIMKLDIEKLFEKECYKILEKIKAILEDNSLNDKDCFQKIESIVCQFEEIGSNCSTRHDF